MLVWTGVATDTRVLREAVALVEAGYQVHVIGRAVPEDFVPPAGVTVGSVGSPPRSAGRTRPLSRPERWVRWALLPEHVDRRLTAWQRDCLRLAYHWAAHEGPPDVVHAHDFTALPVGRALADAWSVPLVYDTHEYWAGRPVEGRPAPVRRRRERREEDRHGARADAVITVGEALADRLRSDHPGWAPVHVVHNSFAAPATGPAAATPSGLLYAGRLAADRELEVIAAASCRLPLPVTLRGPADEVWLSAFDPGCARVQGATSIGEVDQALLDHGVALVTHSDKWLNHRLAMPNKAFHAISLGVPMVATDVGELGALVRAHRLGTLYRPGDVDGLVRASEELIRDYSSYAASVREAAPRLSWGRDAATLRRVYADLPGRHGPLD